MDPSPPPSLSRIDKLFVDAASTSADESRERRWMRGLDIVAGRDVAGTPGLQLALLTAVNLGVKCFAGRTTVHAPTAVWEARCLVPVAVAATLRDAIDVLGGQRGSQDGLLLPTRHLLLGDAVATANAVRITYDGWNAVVGPAASFGRLPEREYCPLASVAAAALGVSEVFAEFAGINVAATRQTVGLSLWRADLPIDHPDALGVPIVDLPIAVGVFGLGHLGQAYLWAFAALPFTNPKEVTVLLCDDDRVVEENVETGALLTSDAITHLKTRTVARWLEERDFTTRLLECRVDQYFRRTCGEPLVALSGFDDNQARRWLGQAGFTLMFDSGLGGEATNFDTIAYRAWPNPRPAEELWPLETETVRAAREARTRERALGNAAYLALGTDDCGRVLLAGSSVAVPFVGAIAAGVVLAEMLKAISAGPTFSELKLRLCSLGTLPPLGHAAVQQTVPRGIPMQRARTDAGSKRTEFNLAAEP